MMFRSLKILGGIAIALLFAGPAFADTCVSTSIPTDPANFTPAAGSTCFELTTSSIGGGKDPSVSAPNFFAEVALLPISGTEIQVTVALGNESKDFVMTGNGTNHPGFGFTLASNSAVITGTGIAGDPTVGSGACTGDDWCVVAQGTSETASSFGSFNYEINSNTGIGGNNQQPGPLVFDVTLASGISVASFISNGTSIFVADVLGIGGGTGLVARLPEAPTPLFFVAGLIGLFAFHRRKALSRIVRR